MLPLEAEENVNSELLELSMHSHDVRNRLSTIKSSAELLLKEALDPGQRELVELIQERAWSAIDLAASFSLERTLKAGLYRPFKKDYVLGDLVQSAGTTLRESTGQLIRLSDQPGLRLRQWIISWNGDENLFLLTLRNMARAVGAGFGPGTLRLGVELRGGDLRWSIEVTCAKQGELPLDAAFLQARAFATALNGRLGRTEAGLVLSAHGASVQEDDRRRVETAFPAPGR